ncbi:hypothetical protein C8Q77DRAFT_304779 [Trametes polyzona]|nr:hypothetical protein C8Q77DRAFT_304779 [Trametes polyzona]
MAARAIERNTNTEPQLGNHLATTSPCTMRTTAATKALLCLDIMTEIFQYFSPGPPIVNRDAAALPQRRRRHGCQKSLASCARVCHAFSGPALDVLWRVVDHLSHLLSVLPSFHSSRRGYVFTRDITDADWARFQSYACRVRELYCRSEKPICASAWIALARRCREGQSLVPQLRKLDAFDVCPYEPGRICLLTPTLRNLTLKIMPAPYGMAEALVVSHTISQAVRDIVIPHLETLRITSSNGFEPINTEITPCALLAHFRELELLSDRGLDRKTLQELLGFPSLRRLVFSANTDFLTTEPPLPPGFEALRDLKVIGRPGCVHAFLRLTSPPALEALALSYTVSEWADVVFEGQAGESFSHTIHRLEISFPSYHFCRNLPVFLQPARELNNLTHFAVKIELLEDQRRLPITDGEMCDLVDAWPDLVDFEISIGEIEGEVNILDSAPCPSARTLVAFAEHHPHLTRLIWPCVCADSEDGEGGAWPALEDVPALNHGLCLFRSCLVSSDRGTPHYRKLALLIDRVFPNLDLSDVYYPTADEIPESTLQQRYGRWSDVEQFLLAIRIVRGETSGVFRQ